MTSKNILIGNRIDSDGNLVDSFDVSRSFFIKNHREVRGKSGDGKTVAETEIACQMIEPDENGERPCLIVIDLGNSLYMRNALKAKCDVLGATFREFWLQYPEQGRFNPTQGFDTNENPVRIASYLIGALGLDHGAGYGRSYFSSENELNMLQAVTAIIKKGGELTVAALAHETAKLTKNQRQGSELVSSLVPLGHYPQLNQISSENAIVIASEIENFEVVYFGLDCLAEPIPARIIAGLVAANVIIAASARTRQGLPRKHTHVIVDEFSQLAGPSWARYLTAARKHNISFSCLYQSTAQLRGASEGLHDILFENTRIHSYFSCIDEFDVDRLRSLSHEDKKLLDGKSGFGMNRIGNEREYIDRKLEINEILSTSATEREFMFVLQDGKFREPMRLRTPEVSPARFADLEKPPVWMLNDKEGKGNDLPTIAKPLSPESEQSIKFSDRVSEFYSKQITEERH